MPRYGKDNTTRRKQASKIIFKSSLQTCFPTCTVSKPPQSFKTAAKTVSTLITSWQSTIQMNNGNLSTLQKLTRYEGLCAYLCGGFNSNHGSHELPTWPLLNQKNPIQHNVRVWIAINKVNKPNCLITYHVSPNYFHKHVFGAIVNFTDFQFAQIIGEAKSKPYL